MVSALAANSATLIAVKTDACGTREPTNATANTESRNTQAGLMLSYRHILEFT